MPAYGCPHCQKSFTAPTSTSAADVLCPHCRQKVEVPKTTASRWYCARAKKKYGPYTWQQLLALAKRGALQPNDLLLQEGAKQWVRADSMASLFAKAAPTANGSATASKKPARPSSSWILAGLVGIGVCAVIGLGAAIGYLLFLRESPIEQPPIADVKDKDPPKLNADAPKKDGKIEEKKKPPEEKSPKTVPRDELAQQFVERLNRHRKSAGLGSVTLDVELSRGCIAHAQYLVKHADPLKLAAFNIADEDPQKPGFSIEGQRAARNAMISAIEPLDALGRWMAQLFQRALLLTPEIQSVGIGFEQTKDAWICVVDRGEAIVVPAPKQMEVPHSFTTGPEVPDEKAVAGYPITVTFPAAKQVTKATIELRDAKGNAIEGWTWTPEKPVPSGNQRNTIALIPKGLLQGSSVYRAKASAQVDGKVWELAWSFTTADNSDGAGVWAKKVVARVNAYRAYAGLKPVELDDKLSRGCLAHARYLVINEGHPALQGLKAHDEDLDLPGASEEGRAAGKASDIAMGDYEPTDGVDAWMATLYHRVPILEPTLKTIGFGCARGRRQGWATVLNVSAGVDKSAPSHPVFYPAPEQTGVRVSFPNGGEEPNPIPGDKTGRAGFPITASFPRKEPFKDATGKLTTDQGAEVLCWFSSPEKHANPQHPNHQGNTACLIPKLPLAANTTYQVHLQGQLAGRPWEKKWKFTTGAAGPSVPEASRQVLDRFNQYRADAGLRTVVLDEALSRGCQLHADYLVKNAEVLLKKNAPVNDEDVSLPGFTRDGLRSAMQSLVFTHAPIPVVQIDDLLASFSGRVYLLDPHLERIGFGCAHDIGRGWRCVLDVNGGRGNSRVAVYPAPDQDDVPLLGFDRIADVKGSPGFPISVVFPRQANLRNVQAVLTDAAGMNVDVWISSPAKPLDAKRQQNIVGIHPLAPLQAGQRYSVIVSAIVDGTEWRESWHFTTSKKK